MDNAHSAGADTPPVTHVATVRGCFGSVNWNVCNELYSIMPRGKRDGLLDMTAQRVIGPFFETTTDRLLAQVECTIPSSALDSEWSLETAEIGCEHVGQIIWQIGQGLWNALPADQRENLLELIKEVILQFFHTDVHGPLFAHAARKLMP